ncbi:MAG TPA: OPT/YSL family transporter, partial [Verrucomicrobiae bacterium]
YIGAGAVTAGGIISLIRSAPTIWHGLRAGLADFSPRASNSGSHSAPRTERDLSMKIVAGGIILLLTIISLVPTLQMNLVGAVLILIFGFLFVTVSSRLCGEIGSSSNPVSGMTVATLLFTSLIFLLVGWTTPPYYVTALTVGAIVCIAASNGGGTSQDLKTGFLVGATPKYQQIAIAIGALASALLMGPILLALNQNSTVYVPASQVAAGLKTDPTKLAETEKLSGRQARADQKSYRVWHKIDATGGPEGRYLVDESGAAIWFVDPGINGTFTKLPDGTEVRKYDAPKAKLMSYIIKGILDRKLPWALVLFGVMISVVLELCGISSLAFAVGVYLPISSSAPIFVGGLVRWLVDLGMRKRLQGRNLTETQLAAESDKSPGVLMASGYIAGGAIAGIIIALVAGVYDKVDARITDWATTKNKFFNGPNADLLSLIPFAILVVLLYLAARQQDMKPAART